MDIKSTLGRKIGPLPAIAWVGMVAAVYVVYRYRKASQSQAALGNQPVVSTGGDIGSASDMSSGWGGAGGTAVGSSTNNPAFTPQDNNDWAKEAINAAIAYGFDPIQANNAVSSWVYGSGLALNEQQSGILRWVLGKLGSPPNPIASPPPTTPAPVPGPPSTPTPTPPPPVTAPQQGEMWSPEGYRVPTPVGGAIPGGTNYWTVWDPAGNPHQTNQPTLLGWYDAPPSTWGN